MTTRISPLFGLALATAVLAAACGAIQGHPGSPCVAASCAVLTPSPSSGSIAPERSASAHGWTTVVDTAGNNLRVRVTVSGPVTVESGCIEALTLWLVGVGGRVDASPTPGVRCQAIALDYIPAGQTRDYRATIPIPAPGTYAVHGLIRVHLPLGAGARVAENIPIVTLTI